MRATVTFLIQIFLCLAALGLLSILVALTIALGGNLPLANAMAIVLFPGIFVVWFPTVLVMTRVTKGTRQRDIWKVALIGCPAWMRTSLYTLIGCGAAIFLFNVVLGGNRKDLPMIYFGAGHMLIFYGLAFSVLYSALHSPRLLVPQHCPAGREVSLWTASAQLAVPTSASDNDLAGAEVKPVVVRHLGCPTNKQAPAGLPLPPISLDYSPSGSSNAKTGFQ